MDFNIQKYLLTLPFLLLGFSAAFSQTTYYSRASQPNPKSWDDKNSWTLNPDGSGPAATDYPRQTDHVVILNGHTVEIDDVNDNGGPAQSANALGLTNVGTFAASGTNNFYHKGNITVESGGTLTTTVRIMLHGTTFVAGTISVGGDLINLGDMFFTSSASFDSQDDLILSGFSNTRIDITNTGNSWTNDDLYMDHTDAWLCGLNGVLEVGIAPNTPELQLLNGATLAQICDVFTITGCVTCPATGTTTFSPTPPVLAGTGTTLTYTENDVVSVDPGMSLTYGEPFLSSAIISVTNNYVDGEDVLALPATLGISSSFNTTSGVLTLTGFGTVPAWESILQSVTYENLSDNPTVSLREISFQITDGFATSNTEKRNIQIQPVNDPPGVSTISGSPGPVAYTEGDLAVAIDNEIKLNDPDDINLEGAVITISANYVDGEDLLDFTNAFGVTNAGFNTTTGELTLTGSATIANYQAALRTVTYENISDNPSTATRTVSFVVNDGDADSPPFTRDIEITAINDPPVNSVPGAQAIDEDNALTFNSTNSNLISISDLDAGANNIDVNLSVNDGTLKLSTTANLTVTGDNSASVAISGAIPDINSALDGLIYTPNQHFNGTEMLTVASDDKGFTGSPGPLTDSDDITINVTAVNDPPAITSTAGTTATEDIQYTYTAAVTDPDDVNNGIDIAWTLSNEPPGMVVSSTGVVTWTPGEGVTTSGTVTLTVEDGDEDGSPPDTEDFTITVTPVNDPPVITSTAGTTATEDMLYTYTAAVTDPDDANNGTDLTWSLTNAPTGMVVSTTGVVTWTPAEGVLTSGTVTLTVADGGEDSAAPDTEDFTITVTPVNDPPVITSTAGTAATESVLYSYTASVTDPDDANNGTDLTWTLTNEPGDMIVSSTGVITWTPAVGVTTSGVVTLNVQDGGEDGAAPDTENFTISVAPFNDPPAITSAAGTTATEDVLYTYTTTVADPDDANNGTDLTWSLSNEPGDMVVSTTGVVTWTPAEGVLSSGTVTLTVQDGGEDGAAPDTEDFIITVTPVNDPPVISSTAGANTTEKTLYTYTATVIDPDDANNGTDLSWSLTNVPGDMVVSSTGEVTWTPAEGVLTSGTVTLTVKDGGEDSALPDTEDFTITVTSVNDPPVITSTAGTTATEEILYTYTATVTDPDDANNGTDLTWSLTNEPAGMVVSATGEVTWTPAEGVLTSGTVTLTVQDGGEDGAVPDTEDFTITVTPVNDPPVITSTAGTTATEETLYTYTATVTDPDDANNGTDLIWSLTSEPAGMVLSPTGEVTWTPGEGVLTSGTVTLTVQDGGEDGAAPDTEDFTIMVTPVNDPPEIAGTSTDLNYTEGDGLLVIDDQVIISDVDDTDLEMATISLGASYVAGEDLLGFVDQSGITGSFDTANGILSLTGTASVGGYTTALTSVTYENTSMEPNTITRSVSFIVNDGEDDSNLFARNILITGVNEPPVVEEDGVQVDTVRFIILEDVISTLCVEVSDPEDNSVYLESVSVTSQGGTFDNGPANDLCFVFLPEADFNGVFYGALTVCDDGNPISCTTVVVEITVLPVNDPPVAEDDEYTVQEDEVVTGNVLDNDTDADGDNLSVTTTPVADPVNGELILNPDGTFTYTPTKDFSGVDFFTYEVCDTANPPACDEAGVTITLQEVEDPVIVYQALTPNDDNFNDLWVIEGIEQFPGNMVRIFDRWSSLVYQVQGYNNTDRVWKGNSNKGLTTGELPDGTYYYVISLGDGSNVLKGFVELKHQ